MDDPLVALSLWQSQESKQKGNTQRQQTVTKSKSSKGGDTTIVANGGTNQVLPLDVLDSNKKVSEERNSDSHLSGKCFPCLPGLELDPIKTNQSKTQKENDRATNASLVNGIVREGCNNDSPSSPGLEEQVDSNMLSTSPLPQLQSKGLLRLFESNVFTIDIAMQYLYSQRDREVQKYLGKKLFVSII